MKRKERPIHVLMIDDDEDEFLLVQDILGEVEDATYMIEWTAKYDEGTHLLRTAHHDVCLLDYHLGDISGLDLLETVDATTTPPVIFMTGQGSREVDDQALEAGASSYLGKDELTPRLLERTIRHAIKQHGEREQLNARAFFDSLTGLPNRTLFDERLKRSIARVRRENGCSAVLYYDLNKFKPINDTYGHDVGDAVLVEFARRLSITIRDTDTVARLGGDEFCIILERLRGSDEARVAETRLAEAMAAPFCIGEHRFELSASVGSSVITPNTTAEEVVRSADQAMYDAKNKRDDLKEWMQSWADAEAFDSELPPSEPDGAPVLDA